MDSQRAHGSGGERRLLLVSEPSMNLGVMVAPRSSGAYARTAHDQGAFFSCRRERSVTARASRETHERCCPRCGRSVPSPMRSVRMRRPSRAPLHL